MAINLHIVDVHIHLSVTKQITPVEDTVIKLIQRGTIGARNKKWQICSKTEFDLDELSNDLGYKEKDKIWKVLKSLETKKIITREKTKSKHLEILGLNPEIWGQILIDSHHEAEGRRNHLKVVDNHEEEPTNRSFTTDEPSVNHRRIVGVEPTNHPGLQFQGIEIIRKKTSLYSSKNNYISSRGRSEDTEVSESGTEDYSENIEPGGGSRCRTGEIQYVEPPKAQREKNSKEFENQDREVQDPTRIRALIDTLRTMPR